MSSRDLTDGTDVAGGDGGVDFISFWPHMRYNQM